MNISLYNALVHIGQILMLDLERSKQLIYSQGKDRETTTLFQHSYVSMTMFVYVTRLSVSLSFFPYLAITYIPSLFVYYHSLYLQDPSRKKLKKYHKQNGINREHIWYRQELVAISQETNVHKRATLEEKLKEKNTRMDKTIWAFTLISLLGVDAVLPEHFLQQLTNIFYPGTFKLLPQNDNTKQSKNRTLFSRFCVTPFIKLIDCIKYLLYFCAFCIFHAANTIFYIASSILHTLQFYRISGFIYDYFAPIIAGIFYIHTLISAAKTGITLSLASLPAIVIIVAILSWGKLLPDYIEACVQSIRLSNATLSVLYISNWYMKIILTLNGIAYLSSHIAQEFSRGLNKIFIHHPDQVTLIKLIRLCPPLHRIIYKEYLAIHLQAVENMLTHEKTVDQKPFVLSKKKNLSIESFINQVWTPFLESFIPRTYDQSDIRFNHNVVKAPSNNTIVQKLNKAKNIPTTNRQQWRKNTLKDLLIYLKDQNQLPKSLPDISNTQTLKDLLDSIDQYMTRDNTILGAWENVLLPNWTFLASKSREVSPKSNAFKSHILCLSDTFKQFYAEHDKCVAGVTHYIGEAILTTNNEIEIYALQDSSEKSVMRHHVSTKIKENLKRDIEEVSTFLRHLNAPGTRQPQMFIHGMQTNIRLVSMSRAYMMPTLVGKLINLKEENVHSINTLSKILAPSCGLVGNDLHRIDDLETSITGDYQLITEFSCIAKDARKKLPYNLYRNGLTQSESIIFENNLLLCAVGNNDPFYFKYAKNILHTHGIDLENKYHRRKMIESATKRLGYKSLLQSPIGRWTALENIVTEDAAAESSKEYFKNKNSIHPQQIINEIQKIDAIERKAENQRSNEEKVELESFYHTLDNIIANILKDPTQIWNQNTETFGDNPCKGFFAQSSRYRTWVQKTKNITRFEEDLYREIITPIVMLGLLDAGVLYRKTNHGPIEKSIEDVKDVQQSHKKPKPTLVSTWVTYILGSVTSVVTAPWRLLESLMPFTYKKDLAWHVPMIFFKIPMGITIDTSITLQQWLKDFAYGSVKNTILMVAYTPPALISMLYNTAKFIVVLALMGLPKLIQPLKLCLKHAYKLVTNLLITPFYIPYKLSISIYNTLKPLASSTWNNKPQYDQIKHDDPEGDPDNPLSPKPA